MSSFIGGFVLGIDLLRVETGLGLRTMSSFIGGFVLGFDLLRVDTGLGLGTLSSFISGFVLGIDLLRVETGLGLGTMSSLVGGFVLGTMSSLGCCVEGFEFVESSVLVFGTRDPLNDFPTFLTLTEEHPPPPIFFFNQSLPLFTALSAICLVTLFTLFANVSNIFEHGVFDLLINAGGFLILLGFGFEDPLVLLLRGFVLEAFGFK
jgi:hypothetical protein